MPYAANIIADAAYADDMGTQAQSSIVDHGPAITGGLLQGIEGRPLASLIGAMTEVMEGRPRP